MYPQNAHLSATPSATNANPSRLSQNLSGRKIIRISPPAAISITPSILSGAQGEHSLRHVSFLLIHTAPPLATPYSAGPGRVHKNEGPPVFPESLLARPTRFERAI